MSRGSVSGKAGTVGVVRTTGMSSEVAVRSNTGNAGCAQQQHVAHVGAQFLSGTLSVSFRPHGSCTTKLESPAVLAVRSATMQISAKCRKTC